MEYVDKFSELEVYKLSRTLSKKVFDLSKGSLIKFGAHPDPLVDKSLRHGQNENMKSISLVN